MFGRLFPACAAASFLFAGCLSQGEEIDVEATYAVYVTASHEVQGDARTFEFSLLQGGKQLREAEYTAGPSTSGNRTEVFNTTVAMGNIYLGVFPKTWHGVSTATVDRVLDVTDCPSPLRFDAHVLEDDVRLTTNCD